MSQKMTIDLDKVLEKGRLAVRRAYIFLGLGYHASNDESLTEFQLPGLFQHTVVPDIDDEQIIRKFREEFGKWVVGNGLRELVEGIESFLDEIYWLCEVLNVVQNGRVEEDAPDKKKIGTFQEKGIAKKLKMLVDEHGIQTSTAHCFPSLTQARHCLTHRRGIVSQRDVTDDDKLVLRWKTLQLLIRTKEGEEFEIDFDETEPVHIEKDSSISMKWAERSVAYEIGQSLEIQPVWLRQICFMINFMIGEIAKSFLEIARLKGVKIKDKQLKDVNVGTELDKEN